jgi:hypothetical protein
MALARIITRSQACSRQLALDLLARGYAVEIVSPDSIPDNIADLELRVDTAPGDQLIASVEAHDGNRSASLDFIHHLKAPMVDFMRRSPDTREAVYFPVEPVSFDAESSTEVEDVELPAPALQLAPEAVCASAEALSGPRVCVKDEHRTAPPETFSSLEMDPPIHIEEEYSAAESAVEPALRTSMVPPIEDQPIAFQPVDIRSKNVWPPRKPQPIRHSARSFKRDALIFASVMLLALVLGYGIRRADSAKPSAQNSQAAPAGKNETVAAASTNVNLWPAANSEKVTKTDAVKLAPASAPSATINSRANSNPYGKQSQDARSPAAAARTSIAIVPTKTSHRQDSDLVARDTVTYLDPRFKPAPKPKSTKTIAHGKPSSHKRGGIVAANSVTYLNNAPAAKTTKQSSTPNPSNVN